MLKSGLHLYGLLCFPELGSDFSTRVCMHLQENIVDMVLHCERRNIQLQGNLLVAQATNKQFDDLALARREDLLNVMLACRVVGEKGQLTLKRNSAIV